MSVITVCFPGAVRELAGFPSSRLFWCVCVLVSCNDSDHDKLVFCVEKTHLFVKIWTHSLLRMLDMMLDFCIRGEMEM